MRMKVFKDDFTVFVNQGISAFVLEVWSGEVNLRKPVTVISITDLHVMVTCCISVTINIYYSPQI